MEINISTLRLKVMLLIYIEGMLFDIGYASGIIPVLAQPEKPVANGTIAG